MGSAAVEAARGAAVGAAAAEEAEAVVLGSAAFRSGMVRAGLQL